MEKVNLYFNTVAKITTIMKQCIKFIFNKKTTSLTYPKHAQIKIAKEFYFKSHISFINGKKKKKKKREREIKIESLVSPLENKIIKIYLNTQLAKFVWGRKQGLFMNHIDSICRCIDTYLCG